MEVMIMKKFSFLVLVVMALPLMFISGCNQQTGTSEEVLKIGANLPLTGTVAYYGLSAKDGIELALDHIRKKEEFEGKRIEVVYEDNQGQAKLAITAMSKLINVNKVPAVIGGGTSTETMAAAPIANENKTILISPVSSATSIAKAGPYIFRTCPSDLVQAEDLGEWVLESGHKKIAVIYANSTWGTGFKNNFVDYFKRNGGEILDVKSSDPGDTNFRTQLSVIKSLNPQALVFIIYAKEGGALMRQTRELGLTQPVFGADPWSQKDFRVGAAEYAEGVMYTTPVQYNGNSFKKFREAFLKKYNKEPDVYSSNGYDCMALLAYVYSEGAKNGEEFQTILSKINGFMGATGVTQFDKNGDVVGKKFGRFVIQNGEPALFKK
jgi:branched-chain amino acid transport system substrate-binding protein